MNFTLKGKHPKTGIALCLSIIFFALYLSGIIVNNIFSEEGLGYSFAKLSAGIITMLLMGFLLLSEFISFGNNEEDE